MRLLVLAEQQHKQQIVLVHIAAADPLRYQYWHRPWLLSSSFKFFSLFLCCG
jgi:hypothetical protein